MEETKKDEAYYRARFWDNMGCLPVAISIAILIWAVSGFPGL